MDRRDFLRNAVVAGLAATLPAPAPAGEAPHGRALRGGPAGPATTPSRLRSAPSVPLIPDRRPRQLTLGGPARLTGRGHRHVSLYNVHTGERMSIDYARDGRYRREGLRALSQFLRDWRSGSTIPFDPEAIDILAALQLACGGRGPLYVLSGYRTRQTNELLRRLGHDVARNSLHMEGKAIDVFLPGYDLKGLRNQALALRAGGVGYYPDRGFIHVDSGSVRTWG